MEVALEQKPKVQGALVAIKPDTGEVKAMVGGYDFDESKFNRATQALRQTGSSFKPFVYTAAIDSGLIKLDDTIVDTPVSFGAYSPGNYDGKFEGTIGIRHAFAESRNVPAIKILARLGVQNLVPYVRRFGITSKIEPVLPKEKFDALKAHFEEKLARLPEGVRPEAMDTPHLTDTKLFEWLFADEVLDQAAITREDHVAAAAGECAAGASPATPRTTCRS